MIRKKTEKAKPERAGGGVAENGAGVGAGVVGAGKAAHHGRNIFRIMSSFCSRAYFLHPPRRKNKTWFFAENVVI